MPVLSLVEGPVLSLVEGPVLSLVEGPVLSLVEGPVLSLVEGRVVPHRILRSWLVTGLTANRGIIRSALTSPVLASCGASNSRAGYCALHELRSAASSCHQLPE